MRGGRKGGGGWYPSIFVWVVKPHQRLPWRTTPKIQTNAEIIHISKCLTYAGIYFTFAPENFFRGTKVMPASSVWGPRFQEWLLVSVVSSRFATRRLFFFFFFGASWDLGGLVGIMSWISAVRVFFLLSGRGFLVSCAQKNKKTTRALVTEAQPI